MSSGFDEYVPVYFIVEFSHTGGKEKFERSYYMYYIPAHTRPAVCLQTLEDELRSERENHCDTKQTLERVLNAKDEQVADLKQANNMLQEQLEKLEAQVKSATNNKTPARPSDRFKVHFL